MQLLGYHNQGEKKTLPTLKAQCTAEGHLHLLRTCLKMTQVKEWYTRCSHNYAGAARLAACSQGHLQSTYQEHATNHNPNVNTETKYTKSNQCHAGRAGRAWPVHLPKSLSTETFKEASKNKSENNFKRTIYFNKPLGNKLATAQRTLVLEHACFEAICFMTNTQRHEKLARE